ncbi:MAG TPA: response regulator [Oligoflexus sp.]|uniref:response regulator n=1 Tax=Oligoflexus sp. TaxID=1971216 RepID=UPI002D7EA9E2|nr:response regulator [Oligoflexus sp.]HET9236922.1 response regulator [Oligoflexus sp.]
MESAPRKGTVLIVDDDDLLREAFVSILEFDGWRTMEARNGKEALNIMRQSPLDVMILDQRMPEMTGKEVYQYMLQHKLNIPVILITAAADIVELVLELGITYYLPKPVGMKALLDTVQRASEGGC